MIEKLYKYASDNGIKVVEGRIPIKKLKGLYADNLIILEKGLPKTELVEILAEELGHYKTSYGNILDQNNVISEKQEHRAVTWADTYLISFDRLIEAFHARISGPHELADFLDVSVDYLSESLSRYKSKYGDNVKVGDYIIYFDPLGILKIL